MTDKDEKCKSCGSTLSPARQILAAEPAWVQRLFETLHRAGGEVVPYSRLNQPRHATIVHHVSMLRAALANLGYPGRVHHVRGQGYRLDHV